jgi:hypothetical protein
VWAFFTGHPVPVAIDSGCAASTGQYSLPNTHHALARRRTPQSCTKCERYDPDGSDLLGLLIRAV